jgi:hypothetical protein
MEAVKKIPYFSQWESRELTLAVLAEGPLTALARDPLWASSGASTIEEYATWAWNACGMACLKMILAARTGQIVPTLELARACTAYGGYTVNADTGAIKGLIYAPFVRFIREQFGISAEVVTNLTAAEIPAIFERAQFFMASVHPSIRWPEKEPSGKGGHLVLCLGCVDDKLVFHNPSGHDRTSQEHAALGLEKFDRFFAGRGVAILR